jgi:hypothetical protein
MKCNNWREIFLGPESVLWIQAAALSIFCEASLTAHKLSCAAGLAGTTHGERPKLF